METQQAEESRPDGQLQDDGAAEPSTSGTAEEQQAPMPFETALTARFRGKYKPLEPPTYEQMMSEDVMNNCFIKSVLAGAMGGALGVAFGLFTASLDTGVRLAKGNVAVQLPHAASQTSVCTIRQ